MAPMSLLFFFCATLFLLAPPSTASTEFAIYSNPPSVLLPGQTLFYDLTPQGIPYGPISLHLQTDCNLVLYYHLERTWATNTSGLGDNCYLALDTHGELLLLRNLHEPVWRSGARSPAPGNHIMTLQWNGGIGVYGPPIWSSGNKGVVSNVAVDNHTTDYVFYSYSVAPVGTFIHYAYKNYELKLRDDCNLILHDTLTGEIKWQTNTYSPYHNCFYTLDDKGELFVKHNRREILWRSGKASDSNLYVLVILYDGTLQIMGPLLWTTKPFW